MKFKSILGLNTVKAFIIVLLSVAIIGVITLVILGSMTTTTSNILPSKTGSVTNETITYPSDTGVSLSASSYPNCQASVSLALNKSRVINVSNYTVSGCKITNITSEFVGYSWNITYSYTYDGNEINGIKSINANVSSGTVSFFSNSITFFALLGVVVIILIISLVVVVVNRFGGESRSENPTL